MPDDAAIPGNAALQHDLFGFVFDRLPLGRSALCLNRAHACLG
jgi:hypothetical protein